LYIQNWKQEELLCIWIFLHLQPLHQDPLTLSVICYWLFFFFVLKVTTNYMASSAPQVITCKGESGYYFLFITCSIMKSMYDSISYHDCVQCGLRKTNKIAAVVWGAGEGLVMEEVEVSPPQPFEIRIKVVSTSICSRDLNARKYQVSLFWNISE
jgi:hypothetical protein